MKNIFYINKGNEYVEKIRSSVFNYQEMIKDMSEEIYKLETNWNSLKDWVFEHIDSIEFNSYDDVLDKMNELEGVANENNNI